MALRMPLTLITLAMAAAAMGPAMANGAVRYAVPTGGASSGSCPASAPCTFATAIQGSGPDLPSDGDEVRMAAGEYVVTTQIANYYRLAISGPEGVYGSDTPWAFVIFPAAADGGMLDGLAKFIMATGSAGSSIRRVAFSGRAVNTQLLNFASSPGGVLDRVEVYVRGTAGAGVLGSDMTITNSRVVQSETDIFGVAAAISGRITGSSVTSDNGTALSLYNNAHGMPYCALLVRNTIAVGGRHNAEAEYTPPAGSNCTSASMTISSSWVPASGTGGGLSVAGAPDASITDGAGNLPAAPALTAFDAYGGNWLFPFISPSVNAGCTSGCGTTDLYGRPRPIGVANDIGAGESSLPPSVGPPTATDVGTAGATLSAVVNPGYAATSYRVQYRRDDESAWQDVASGDVGSGTADEGASARATGLAAATAYVARVVATNSVGATTGAETPFRTAAAPSTPAGPGVLVATWSRRGATVRALVTPRAGVTSYRISALRTKGGSKVTRTGRCVAATVGKAKRQRCTISLRKGTWTVSVRGTKGPALVARATRTYVVKP